MTNSSFNELKEEGTISLTSYYTSGKAVSTPVGYSKKGNKIFVNTPEQSYKVKRIRNNPKIKIALCNMRGSLQGPQIEATARVLNEYEESEAKEAMKYDTKFTWKMYRLMNKIKFWKKPGKRVFIEINPVS